MQKVDRLLSSYKTSHVVSAYIPTLSAGRATKTCFQSSGHLIKPQRIWMQVVFSLHWSDCVGEEEQHNNWARNTDEVPVCSAFWKHAYSLCFVLLFSCWCCTLLSCHMWCRPWSPHSPRLTAPLHTRTSGAHLERKHLSSSLLERGTGDQGDMRTEYKGVFATVTSLQLWFSMPIYWEY